MTAMKAQQIKNKLFGSLPYTARFYLLPMLFMIAIIGTSISISLDKPFSLYGKKFNNTAEELSQPLPANLLTINKVKTLASAEMPGRKITNIKLVSSGEKLVYLISLAEDTKLALDAHTGEKLSEKTASTSSGDASEPEDNTFPDDFVPSIGFDLAQSIALSENPSGFISNIELVTKSEVVVYSVEFSDGRQLLIEAENGDIIQPENGHTTDSGENESSTTTNTDEVSEPDNTPEQPQDDEPRLEPSTSPDTESSTDTSN